MKPDTPKIIGVIVATIGDDNIEPIITSYASEYPTPIMFRVWATKSPGGEVT